jgi:hypothetical protein
MREFRKGNVEAILPRKTILSGPVATLQTRHQCLLHRRI